MFSRLVAVVDIGTDSIDSLFLYLLFIILSNFLLVLQDLFAMGLSVDRVEGFVSLAEVVLDLGIGLLLQGVFLAVEAPDYLRHGEEAVDDAEDSEAKGEDVEVVAQDEIEEKAASWD